MNKNLIKLYDQVLKNNHEGNLTNINHKNNINDINHNTNNNFLNRNLVNSDVNTIMESNKISYKEGSTNKDGNLYVNPEKISMFKVKSNENNEKKIS